MIIHIETIQSSSMGIESSVGILLQGLLKKDFSER